MGPFFKIRQLANGRLRLALPTTDTWNNLELAQYIYVMLAIPDGNSALMLAAARLRHIAGTQWGMKRYMNMDRLKELKREQSAMLEGVAG